MSKIRIFGLDSKRLGKLLSVGDEVAASQPLQQPTGAGDCTPGSNSPGERTLTVVGLSEQSGSWIGPYKLLDVLGEGGMGIVYLAEQEHPVRRQVALKVVKPGMDSRRAIARFEAEQQALAMMEHPHIAHVYHAGLTPSGRPYFVMEHVKGVAITEHCDRSRLTIEQRLHLFLHVCEAVQHAHQKGIIHRDLKPSNILVAIQDQEAVPKVIDFGVARAIGEPLTEQTLFTEQGQLIGTPEYMSPEQAGIGNQDTDTRTDVYSLGVILYVLLSGVLPFDPGTFREGGIEGIRKIICEEEPKTPSTRLSKTSIEEAAKSAQCRQTEIRTLQRRLHGDLDWITLKALEKDRARRYGTVEAMAADVRNHLQHQPVTAAPPGTLYRMGKFVRRHRQAVALVGTAMMLLLALSWAAYVRIQADREQTYAQTLRDERILAEARLLARLGPQSWDTWFGGFGSNAASVGIPEPARSLEGQCLESIRVCSRALEVRPDEYAYHLMRTVSALAIGDSEASAYLHDLERILGRMDVTSNVCSHQVQQILYDLKLREQLLPLALVLARKAVAQQVDCAIDIASMLRQVGQQEQAGRLLQMAETAPLKGGCRYENGSDTYTVSGCGTNIFGATDEFHFASKEIAGDGSITVRIESVEDVHVWAKAGVMIRESLAPGAKFAAVYATPGAGVHFEVRSIADGSVSSDSAVATPEQIALRAPIWVKIERRGDQFSAFCSADGVTWPFRIWTPQTVPMPDSVHIGLAVTSHDRRRTAEARMSHVITTGNITPSGPFTESQDIFLQLPPSFFQLPSFEGAVAWKGSCQYQQGLDTYTLVGGGTGIHGTADEFHFAVKKLTGDGSITAKVEGVEEANAWTKAGIMIRDSLDPGAKFTAVYATPTGVCWEFRPRINSRARQSGSLGERPSLHPPVWVRIERHWIERRGYLFAFSCSSDGETWTQIGSIGFDMPRSAAGDSVYVGLVVTSGDPGKTTEARVSHVTTTGEISPPGPFTESRDICHELPPTLGGTGDK